MTDKLKSGTKAWAKRQDIWRHNSFLGMAAMMKANANTIATSKTAAYDAKRIAVRIGNLAIDLQHALKTRIDP